MTEKILQLDGNDLEILLMDFGKISEKVLGYPKIVESHRQNIEKGIKDFSILDDEVYRNISSIRLYNNRLAYYHTPNDLHDDPIGNPIDYLTVKSNFGLIKEFVEKTLDRGKLVAGYNAVCDTARVINSSDYIVWLYKYCENSDFKTLLAKSVTGLLHEEINKDFNSSDITKDYNRLVGLLEVVESAGNSENEFSESYNYLKDKLFSGCFKSIPELRHDFFSLNIHDKLVSATAVLEKDHDLRDFWLENVKNGLKFYGYFFISSYKSKEEKKQQITFLLEKLRLLNDDSPFLLRYIANELNDNFNSSYSFNKDNACLYILNNAKVENNNCYVNVTKYSREEIKDFDWSYDLNKRINVSKESDSYHLKRLAELFLHSQSESV